MGAIGGLRGFAPSKNHENLYEIVIRFSPPKRLTLGLRLNVIIIKIIFKTVVNKVHFYLFIYLLQDWGSHPGTAVVVYQEYRFEINRANTTTILTTQALLTKKKKNKK